MPFVWGESTQASWEVCEFDQPLQMDSEQKQDMKHRGRPLEFPGVQSPAGRA